MSSPPSDPPPEPPPGPPGLEHLAWADLLERAAAALRQSEERYEQLARTAGDERQELERRLVEGALRDPLTGLPNRALFLDRLEHALVRAGRTGSSVAVVFCDLDRFRTVNETFGHQGGDRIMAAVASRLLDQMHDDDTVARMGGDEFAVLCEDLDGGPAVAEVARRTQEVFAAPFTTGGTEVWVTASAGIAVATGGESPDIVCREAAAAMAQAQQRGRGRVEVFDDAMRSVAPWRRVTEHELRQAILTGELRIVYQPVVALDDGHMGGVEALVRWQHPSRGLLLPGDFIPLAEESGLVVPLGRWVLAEACRQAVAWSDGRRPDGWLTLAVNVSAQQFHEAGWGEEVADVLSTVGLPADRLVLEITESTLMEDTEVAVQRLTELRSLGVRLAVDDFGTGYSSLAYLRRMPVDLLKIDKAFVDGVTGDPHESALARAVVKLATTLGLSAVAEGIERRAQAEVLRSIGCEYGQGHWLAPPEPAERITERLRTATRVW